MIVCAQSFSVITPILNASLPILANSVLICFMHRFGVLLAGGFAELVLIQESNVAP